MVIMMVTVMMMTMVTMVMMMVTIGMKMVMGTTMVVTMVWVTVMMGAVMVVMEMTICGKNCGYHGSNHSDDSDNAALSSQRTNSFLI